MAVAQMINTNQDPTATGTQPDDLVSLSAPVYGFLDKQWTYEEYLEELKQPIDYPDKNDPNDPRYYRRYAHNLPPLGAYYLIPDRADLVARDDATKNDRRVYFGWNNVTSYERQGVLGLQSYIKNKGINQMPPGFEWRDWLKWIQSCHYDVVKAGEKLYSHVQWLNQHGPEPRLTDNSLALLQSGCFYIHGRDRFYRPCVVLDGQIMADIARRRPELITAEIFEQMFTFMFNYIRKCLLLPGQVEQWVSICDLNHMGATALPRQTIMGFGNLCQNNLMYFLYRSFYCQVSMAQRFVYKAISAFIDPETKLKIVIDGQIAPEAMTSLFHPSQLETKFGGTAETVTNFWPPFMGGTVIPEDAPTDEYNLITPDRYEESLEQNPELYVHPQHMKPGRCENMHFKLPEPAPQPVLQPDQNQLISSEQPRQQELNGSSDCNIEETLGEDSALEPHRVSDLFRLEFVKSASSRGVKNYYGAFEEGFQQVGQGLGPEAIRSALEESKRQYSHVRAASKAATIQGDHDNEEANVVASQATAFGKQLVPGLAPLTQVPEAAQTNVLEFPALAAQQKAVVNAGTGETQPQKTTQEQLEIKAENEQTDEKGYLKTQPPTQATLLEGKEEKTEPPIGIAKAGKQGKNSQAGCCACTVF